MDQFDISNVITNGTYHYPAMNRHLVPFIQDTVICSVCRNNKDNVNYYDVFLKETQRVICQTCCNLYDIYIQCDNCHQKRLEASIGFANFDLCLKCAYNGLSQSKTTMSDNAAEILIAQNKELQYTSKLTINNLNYEYEINVNDSYNDYTFIHIIVDMSICYLSDPCQHPVTITMTPKMGYIEIIKNMTLDRYEIIKLLDSYNCTVPEHFKS